VEPVSPIPTPALIPFQQSAVENLIHYTQDPGSGAENASEITAGARIEIAAGIREYLKQAHPEKNYEPILLHYRNRQEIAGIPWNVLNRELNVQFHLDSAPNPQIQYFNDYAKKTDEGEQQRVLSMLRERGVREEFPTWDDFVQYCNEQDLVKGRFNVWFSPPADTIKEGMMTGFGGRRLLLQLTPFNELTLEEVADPNIPEWKVNEGKCAPAQHITPQRMLSSDLCDKLDGLTDDLAEALEDSGKSNDELHAWQSYQDYLKQNDIFEFSSTLEEPGHVHALVFDSTQYAHRGGKPIFRGKDTYVSWELRIAFIEIPQ